MDSKELINEHRQQIVACEQTIQQNLGVIQYCKGKIAQLEKPSETAPTDGGTPQ